MFWHLKSFVSKLKGFALINICKSKLFACMFKWYLLTSQNCLWVGKFCVAQIPSSQHVPTTVSTVFKWAGGPGTSHTANLKQETTRKPPFCSSRYRPSGSVELVIKTWFCAKHFHSNDFDPELPLEFTRKTFSFVNYLQVQNLWTCKQNF